MTERDIMRLFEKYDGEFQRELTGVFGDQALCLGLDPDQLLLLVSGEERDPVKDAEYLSSWLRRTYGGEFYMAVSRKISYEEERSSGRNCFIVAVSNHLDSVILHAQHLHYVSVVAIRSHYFKWQTLDLRCTGSSIQHESRAEAFVVSYFTNLKL